MENERSFDDLVVKVAELHRALQGLTQTQIDAHIKKTLRLNTPQYWDASGLKDEMDFFFDE